MTDLEKFVELYKGFGINLSKIEKTDSGYKIEMAMFSYDDMNESNKFEGYSGFYTAIKFDNEGKFLSQGFWE